MTSHKSPFAFIGGGWIEAQLLYMIPIIDGYCKSRKIKTLCFDEKIPESLIANSDISGILNQYQIIYCPSPKYFIIQSLLSPFATINFIYKKFFISRSDLLGNNNWQSSQINHGIWDLAINRGKDGMINPTLPNKLYSILRALSEVLKGKWLISNGLNVAFLGHTVYASRALLATIRTLVPTYSHSGHHIYKLPPSYDTSASRYESSFIDMLSKTIPDTSVDNYWEQRLRGFSAYEDANLSSSKGSLSPVISYENVIMLHVFRDSPFNYIETSRIFADYIDWALHTFEAIAKSDEKWVVKFHPSAGRWGENQDIWMEKLMSISHKNRPKNIFLDKNSSNIEIFKCAKRIVTYAGTAHLEASAFGIKPIVIDGTTLGDVMPNGVLNPGSLRDYDALLNLPSSSDIFRQNNEAEFFAKKLIYIREVVTNLKVEVGGLTVYRGDSIEIFRKDFDITSKKIHEELNFLKSLGREFSKNLCHTLNKSAFNSIYYRRTTNE